MVQAVEVQVLQVIREDVADVYSRFPLRSGDLRPDSSYVE
jgi:hypothetical protein